jgi:hypothetical protein
MYAVLSGNAVTGNLLSNGIKMTDRKKSYFLHAVKNTDILSYTVLRVFFDIVCNTSVFHNLIYAISVDRKVSGGVQKLYFCMG